MVRVINMPNIMLTLVLVYLVLSDDPVGLRWFSPLQDDLLLIGTALNGIQRDSAWHCGKLSHTHLLLKKLEAEW